MLPKSFFLASLALLATPALSDTILVRGEYLPPTPGTPIFGRALLTPERLDEARDASLESLLSEVAGFQQFRRADSRSANPSAQGATLRALGGNAASRASLTIDGVPMTDPFFGYIPFSALAPERLEEVRLVRGTDIGAFGAGMAGTIELRSARPGTLAPVEAQAMVGSDRLQSASGTVSAGLGSGHISISARYEESDGFDTTPKDQHIPWTANAAWKGWSTTARMLAPVDDVIELQGRIMVFRDDRTLRFQGANSMSRGEDASLALVANGKWGVEALAYLQARDFSNIIVSATTGKPTVNQRATPSTGVGLKLELRPPVENGMLRLGADWRRATGDMDEYSILATGAQGERRMAGGAQRVVGAFLSYEPVFGPVTASVGGRVEHWTIKNGHFTRQSSAGQTSSHDIFPNRSGTAATARVGLMADIAENWGVRMAFSTGYRLPTLNELYRPYTVFPVVTTANAELSPERLWSAEAGFDGQLGPVQLGTTIFYNRLKDAISNVTIGPNLRQRRNVPAIEVKGAELTATALFGEFALDTSLAFSDAKVDAPGLAFDGLRPAQVPKLQASGTLSWRPENGARLSATVRHVGGQYEDDLMTDRLPSYVTAGARARIPLAYGLSLVARIENIFDAKIQTRNAGGSIDYAAPRLFAVGLSYGDRANN